MLRFIYARALKAAALSSLALAPSVFAQAPAVPVAPTVPSPVLPLIPPPAPPTNVPLSPLQAQFLIAWLAGEAEQGLTAAASVKVAQADNAALIAAVLDRARALHSGRIGEEDFLEVWAVRPEPYDPVPSFLQAVANDRVAQWAANLTPPYAGYEGLRIGLAVYQEIRAAGGWPKLTAKATPEAIRARLTFEDKAVTPTEPIAEALQRAQRRYGLNPTGQLDARTLTALNVPVEDRIAAIMANMERWRWMPKELPVNRVQVNIAAAVLSVFEGDNVVASMRAVTGSPANQTPMLVSSIHSVVLNPPWNVPASIAKKELWPKGRAALLAQGYRIVGTPETGERIVQPAGPNSALGRLKFDFDNPFAVYLHDTPSRSKFASFDRLASHGCVRLERPLALAELMFKDDPKFAGQIQTQINTGKTQRVTLPKQVAVYLLYWTAFASANGTMNFRADPYGWDKLLAQKIEASSRRADTLKIASKD